MGKNTYGRAYTRERQDFWSQSDKAVNLEFGQGYSMHNDETVYDCNNMRQELDRKLIEQNNKSSKSPTKDF